MKPSLTLAAAALSLAGAAAHAATMSEAQVEAKARAIQDRVISLDTHVDIPLNYATSEMDPGGFTSDQVDLPKMRAGGLDAAFLIVYTPQGPLTDDGYAEARAIAQTRWRAIVRLTAAYPKQIGLATTAADVARIAKSGRKVALIGMENPYPLGPSVDDVPLWASRGVRYMGLTHFGHNQFGDSANPHWRAGDKAAKYNGLSDLGKDLVAALNRAGVMIDVSHAGRETMMQATALSKAPIIASHSACKALADSPRNLDDEQLRAIAKNGGVAQMVALSAYVKDYGAEVKANEDALKARWGIETDADIAKLSDEDYKAYDEAMTAIHDAAPKATVSDFVDHIDHAVMVAGIDHVGIASDFDGGGGIDGWNDASETLAVTEELVRRGYTEDQIEKIWSGNLLRVMREVEDTAKRMQRKG